MEPILLVIGAWWWVAPAVAGAGAASYAALTTNRRRARRLELDAARHEESQAYRALVAAKAQVRTAQADVLAERARTGQIPTTSTFHVKQDLQAARRAEKSAALALRASRTRVKASYSQYHASSAKDPLPLERLYAAHDAVNARWLAYETDVDRALAFPQMTDSRHPSTVAFLRAQREAQHLRPSSPQARVTPEEYLAYRNAVQTLQVAFDEAERRAGAAERPVRPAIDLWAVAEWILPRSSNDTPRSSG